MNARSRSWPAVLILLAALLSANIFHARPAQARSDVDINIFYNALAPYGTWVDHSGYGRVWYPRGVAAGWRPYSDGRWAYNAQYGWIWVSDWVWGWAPFHYGRWAWDDWYGWIWVPGRVWAPAWVFWRYGGGYAAWAPMPPNAYWQPGYGLNTRYFDYDRDLRRDWWVSVPDRHLHDRHMRRHLIHPRHNDRVLHVTNNFVNVTNINNVVVNHGVPVRDIERRSGRKVRSIPVREVERPPDRKMRRTPDALTLIRPKLSPPDAGDIRRQEELARRVSLQNEQQRQGQGRPDGRRADERPATPLPGRLRKGAPDTPPKGSQTIMPSFDSQPRGRPAQPPDVSGKPQPGRRGEGRPEQPRPVEERRRQEEQTPPTRDATVPQRQLQERGEQQRQRQLEERRRQEQPDRARDEAVWRQMEEQRRQRQMEEQRRQNEQTERIRAQEVRQQQLRQREEQQLRQQQMREREEHLRQQQLQQRQFEERRRQQEHAERARDEAIRQRQLQQQQLEQRRRQQEHAERAREEAIRQRQMQQQQFEQQRRQQLQQQRQFEEQRRQQEIERQQMQLQRQREVQQRQSEIQRQQHEQRRQQQMQRQDNRPGYPGFDR